MRVVYYPDLFKPLHFPSLAHINFKLPNYKLFHSITKPLHEIYAEIKFVILYSFSSVSFFYSFQILNWHGNQIWIPKRASPCIVLIQLAHLYPAWISIGGVDWDFSKIQCKGVFMSLKNAKNSVYYNIHYVAVPPNQIVAP